MTVFVRHAFLIGLLLLAAGLAAAGLAAARSPAQTGGPPELEPVAGPFARRTVYTNSHALVVGISRYAHPPATRQRDRPSGKAGERRTNPVDGAEMVWVPAGEFRMGSTDCGDPEKPVHRVRITRGFWLYRTEVTNAQYARFLAANPSRGKPALWEEQRFNGPQQPVVGVNWTDATAYSRWVGSRLPTEAEWEYAARGSDGRTYPWGDQALDTSRAVFDLPSETGRPRNVGSLPSGAAWCGALDMAGNVREWCNDRYDQGFYAVSPVDDPAGPTKGSFRVIRGGSWLYPSGDLRAAYRDYAPTDGRSFSLGIRPARTN